MSAEEMMTRFLVRPVLLLIASVLFPATSLAQSAQPAPPPPSPVTTELRTQLGISYNNLGLQQSLEWSRKRLLRPGSGPMGADAHLMFGAQLAVSPSYARVNVWGQFAPVSILVVRAGVDQGQYFGTFDSLLPFDRPEDLFDTDSRKERPGAKADRVRRLYLSPTLRLRVGRILAAGTADLEQWSSSSDGAYFYEPTRDTLLKSDNSALIGTRAIVMYEHMTDAGSRIAIGGLFTLQRVDDKDLNKVKRLGAILSLQSDARRFGLNQPTLNLIVTNYLDDPWKDGEWSAAMTIAATLRR
jgi:hypothetical protein